MAKNILLTLHVAHCGPKHMPGLLGEHQPVAGLEVVDLYEFLGVRERGQKLRPPRRPFGLFPVIQLFFVT